MDSVLQAICEHEIDAVMTRRKPDWASVVVMDPRNGDVLAMANRPAFDLGDRRSFRKGVNDRCRAVEVCAEPGSVFKPIVLAGAYEQGLVRPTTRVFCHNGVYHTGGRILHDHHPYGWLTCHEIVVKSSNIGIAKIGQMMGCDRLHGLVRRLGFGSPTGVQLGGESPGIVRARPKWSNYSLTSVPMGHEISATPLQMARAFSALANGGVLPPVRIAVALLDRDRSVKKVFGGRRRRVLSRSVCRTWIREAMADVVKLGTGKRAALARYTVGGKTGTAQMLNEDGTYSHSEFLASFIGVAPMENPRLVVIVSVANPKGGAYYGGTVAAPAVARIIDRSLMMLGAKPSGSGMVARRLRSHR